MKPKTETNFIGQSKISSRKPKFPWAIGFPSGTTIRFAEKPSDSWLNQFNGTVIKAPKQA
jgi:hypothetical protein